MHPVDVMIVVSIACMFGFTPLLYVKKDIPLAIGYLVASTAGAFTGAYIALWYFPAWDKLGLISGGAVGAFIPVMIWHLIRKGHDR